MASERMKMDDAVAAGLSRERKVWSGLGPGSGWPELDQVASRNRSKAHLATANLSSPHA